MYALNLYGVTTGFLFTKLNAFVMLGATRALTSCGWNGRDMINLKTVGWHGLPCYRMFHTWYMRLRLTHRCSSLERALLSVLPQLCVTVCCHRLRQHYQSRHLTLVKFGVLWLFGNPIVWEWSCLVSLPQPPPALVTANRQPHLIGRVAIGAGVVVSRRSTLRSGSSRGGS